MLNSRQVEPESTEPEAVELVSVGMEMLDGREIGIVATNQTS